MAKKETKKSDQNELIENPEVIAEKLVSGEDFLKSNSKIIAGILVVAVVLIGGVLFFQYNTQQQNERAVSVGVRLVAVIGGNIPFSPGLVSDINQTQERGRSK